MGRFAIQPSFAGGEFAPSLQARVDLNKYLTGAKTLRNVCVIPHGGVRNRPGTKYVATAGDSTHRVRLIPFVAATDAAYIIELGQYYARFYKNDGLITNVASPGIDFDPSVGYLTNQIVGVGDYLQFEYTGGSGGGGLTYAIAAPVGFDTSGVKIAMQANSTDDLAVTWTGGVLTIKFATTTQAKNLASLVQVAIRAANAQFYAWTVTQDTAAAVASGASLSATSLTAHQVTYRALGDMVAGTYNSNYFPPTNNTSPYWTGNAAQIPTPWTDSDIFGLKFVQSADTLYIAHSNYAPQKIVTYADSQWSIKPFSFSNGPFMLQNTDTAFTLTPSATTGSMTLTAAKALFESGHVNALFQIKETIVAQTITDASFTSNSHACTAIKCGPTWSIITFGTWTGKILVQISTDAGSTWQTVQTLQSSGTNNYQTSGSTGVSQCLLRVSGDGVTTWSGTLTIDLTASSFDWVGVVQITAVASNYSATATVVNTDGLASTTAQFQWSEGSWSTLRGWPAAVAFYQDRSIWGGTKAELSTGWASKTASYGDFGVSAPIVDSDSLSFVLPSRQLNAIQNFVVMPQFLVALTSDSEWAISPGSGGVFSPTSIQQQLQGHRGSSSIIPAVVGIELILMQQMGTVVRNLIYQLAVNGFFGDNISIVSQHLFTGYTITEMSYQQEPDSLIWMVRSDGQLLCCTYMRDQEMNAWTHHDTNGYYESVCTIPNQTLGINETWFVVKRTINGVTNRYIERLTPRDQGTDPAQQFFVDCGLSYSGAATKSFTAAHLPNTNIAVLADGNVIPDIKTDGSGNFSLSVAAAVVQAGLPYVADVETLRTEIPDQKGTLQGRRVALTELMIRFWNSRGGYHRAVSDFDGPTDDTITGFDEILQREVTDDNDTPIALKTRDYKLATNGGYDLGSRVFFRQVDPLPFTILSIMPTVTAGEK